MSGFASALLLLQAATAPDTTITIRTEGSTLEFVPAALSLKAGTRVRVILENAGSLPHNIVFVRSEAEIDPLAEAAARAGGDYLPPPAQRDKLIGFTRMASPGESVETSFTVPPPGEYPFVCLVSGHALVMLGTLRALR